jgi:hypothetical protein
MLYVCVCAFVFFISIGFQNLKCMYWDEAKNLRHKSILILNMSLQN